MNCGDCGQDRPINGRGLCRTCYSRWWVANNKEKDTARRKKYHQDNKEKINARGRKWQKENRERHRETVRRFRERHADRVKEQGRKADKKRAPNKKEAGIRNRLKQFSLSREYYDSACVLGCPICHTAFSSTPCFDHCHKTGIFRGLLCSSCNKGIGLLKDSEDVLLSAASYLKEFNSLCPHEKVNVF